jgi:hypothetical protein
VNRRTKSGSVRAGTSQATKDAVARAQVLCKALAIEDRSVDDFLKDRREEAARDEIS